MILVITEFNEKGADQYAVIRAYLEERGFKPVSFYHMFSHNSLPEGELLDLAKDCLSVFDKQFDKILVVTTGRRLVEVDVCEILPHRKPSTRVKIDGIEVKWYI